MVSPSQRRFNQGRLVGSIVDRARASTPARLSDVPQPFGGRFNPNSRSPFSSPEERREFFLGQRTEPQTAVASSDASPLLRAGLPDVNLGASPNLSNNFGSIDELVKSRTDPALGLLRGGTDEALRLSELGQQEFAPLEQFGGLDAFNEQNALLGLSGQEAQEEAIGNLPISAFDRELQQRQSRGQLRRANAAGELGSGATLRAAQQLAGGQQADLIQRRLQQLEPLIAASRGVRSTLSGVDEAARSRQAQLESGLGIQEANIRLGSQAPLIQSNLQNAELSGLQRISSANRRGQTLGQVAGLAGRVAPQIGSLISSFGSPPTTNLQTGGFIPEAGTIGLA